MTIPRLDVRDIRVGYGTGPDGQRVLGPVAFSVDPGEIVGVIGESGSGKSTLAFALMDLLPQAARIGAFDVRFEGRPLQDLSGRERRALLGGQIAFIPQEPMTALNPTLRTGAQVDRVLKRHLNVTAETRRRRLEDALARLQVADPRRVLAAYPFALSGGQIQRILIAQAIALDAPLIIADEPTTALDVTVQAEVLADLKRASRADGRSLFFVSHSIGVVWSFCDRVLVMKDGEIVEQGPTRDVIDHARHPYTRRLIAALPSLSAPRTHLPVEEPV